MGRPPGPWYGNERERLRFERAARPRFPGLRGGPAREPVRGYRYRVILPVEHYEDRHVEVRFARGGRVPGVFADGPPGSPHRYADGSLCMWFPSDPPERRWVFADGLSTLLETVQLHLFREAFWRENAEWLGEEAPHKSLDEGPR